MINPVQHSNHADGSTGNSCVECHMPKTTYMMRDPRRDHGFIIPDPLMTKELGLPNACNRCHEDQSVDWAVDWAAKWYGEGNSTNFARERTRLIARAQQGDETVIPELLKWAKEEPIPAWRATILTLLGTWNYHPEVQAFLNESLKHDQPLVRSEAIRSMEFIPNMREAIKPFLADPVRLVRIDAAWSLRDELTAMSTIQAELSTFVDNQSDQPTGAMRQGELALSQGDTEKAITWFKKAVDWSPDSPWFHHRLGVVYHLSGQSAAGAVSLEKAAELDPQNSEHPYALALLYGEQQDLPNAIRNFERAVTARPDFARAWYNLGLARAQAGEVEGGIAAILEAEIAAPEVHDFPHARATLHYRVGQMDKARKAGRKALALAPDSPQLQQFVLQLEQTQP